VMAVVVVRFRLILYTTYESLNKHDYFSVEELHNDSDQSFAAINKNF
jgi:hypothetical protein